MMFQIISDIHLEYYDELPDITTIFQISAPNLILAGDICYYKHKNFIPFFELVNKLYTNVFFVPGNHDYYSYNNVPECEFGVIDFIMEENLKPFKNIHFIQNSIFEINNTIILGNTLWCNTDRNIKDPNVKLLSNPYYIQFGKKYMPTFNSIKKTNHIQYNWLKNTLKNINHDKKIIVITHYLPSKKCIHKKYSNSQYNDLYFTNCEDIMKFADVWVSGHTHNKFTGNINNCVVFINPRGDPDEITNYNKTLNFEIDYVSHL